MRGVIVALDNGLAFAAREAETAAEEAAGVDALGPTSALLFSRPGPVTLARTRWALDLVWLAPQLRGGGWYVVAVERAMPGTSGYGLRRAASTRLLELPASWGLPIAPGSTLRLLPGRR